MWWPPPISPSNAADSPNLQTTSPSKRFTPIHSLTPQPKPTMQSSNVSKLPPFFNSFPTVNQQPLVEIASAAQRRSTGIRQLPHQHRQQRWPWQNKNCQETQVRTSMQTVQQTRPWQTRLQHPYPLIHPLPCLRMDEKASRIMWSSRHIPSTMQTSSREQDPLSRRIRLTPENPDSPSTLAVTHHIHQVWNPWEVGGVLLWIFLCLYTI